MQGSKTPLETELAFREHYLVTGNVAGSARAVKLPVRTGYELARRADEDEEFAKACVEYRARVLPNAERMANAAMQLCLERLNKEPPDIEKLATLGAQKVTFQDAGPQYAASLGKLLQAITMGRRFESERSGEIASEREVTINIVPVANPNDGAGEKPAG